MIVCEASSFQLEDTVAFAPECAVLLNLEPDHIDRHGTFEAYRDAKMRIFANQGPGDLAIQPPFPPLPIAADELRLRGAHNVENARAASAAALARGLAPDAVAEALRTFGGVPHRLEEVAEAGGVTWINDSKATNVASARVGIEAFEGGVHLIAGGSLKGGGFEGLRDAVAVALQGRLPGRRGERPAGRRPRSDRSAAGALRRPRACRRSRRRRRRARRRGAPVAGVRELRPVRGLRGARGPLPRVGAATSARGMNSRGRVEKKRDGAQPPAHETPARVLADLHGDALPARARGDHGLLRELRGVPSRRLRRPVVLPQALRRAGDRRARRPSLRLTARAEGRQGGHARPAAGFVRVDGPRDAAGRRCDGERRDPLAGRRPAAVPALRAA